MKIYFKSRNKITNKPILPPLGSHKLSTTKTEDRDMVEVLKEEFNRLLFLKDG